MRFSSGNAAAFLALCQSGHALKATILADTNRDGRVDNSDLKGKDVWSQDKGALFLANIGDTDQRCSKNLVPPEWPELECGEIFHPRDQIKMEEYLDLCNDASDDVQRNPKYLAPLRTLPVKEKLSADATARIYVTDERAANNSRIFVKSSSSSGWTYVGANHTFTAAEFKDGLELGIDARDVRRPGPEGWNGNANVHFTIRSAGKEVSDSVALRVAPVLTHHHAQTAERFFSTHGSDDRPVQARFVDDLLNNTADFGVEEPFLFSEENGDIWTQDFFEPGYTSIPGPDGPVVLRILIRSAQSFRWSGRSVFTDLRSDTVGAVQHIANGGTTDSTGNLETVPPHTHKGKSYPAGRVIMGAHEEKEPLVMEFLRAQEVQAPILLDTDWLYVGHVDEFLQFLPFPNERGWVLMADEPLAGLAILEKAAADGHGAKGAISRPAIPGEQQGSCILPLNETISQVLDLNLTAANTWAAERIELNLEILKREVGITDDDIFRVPGIFTDNYNAWASECEEGWDEEVEAGDGGFDSSARAKRQARSAGGPIGQAFDILAAGTPPRPQNLRNLKRQDEGDGEDCELDWEEYCKLIPEHCEEEPPRTPPQQIALYPSAINSLVMSDSRVLAANPWGPIIDGVDVFAQAVVEAYAKVNYSVTFQDNWFSHHMGYGEIHCGSNSWRKATNVWWKN